MLWDNSSCKNGDHKQLHQPVAMVKHTAALKNGLCTFSSSDMLKTLKIHWLYYWVSREWYVYFGWVNTIQVPN